MDFGPPAPDTSTSFATYTQYIGFLVQRQPQLEWLHRLLCRPAAQDPSRTNVFIADSENGQLTEKATPLHAVRHRPMSAKTRVIVVRYEFAWGIDREVIDEVAFAGVF